MFIKLTNKHKKRILWAMLIVIVPAFLLWGSSAMRGNDANVIGEIEEKPIKRDKFIPYLESAQLYWLMNAEKDQELEKEDITALAGDFYLLSYQADKEKISIPDQEVVGYIQSIPFFASEDKFDPKKYQQFIKAIQRRMGRNFTARNFEEYIRNILKKDKLLDKNIDVEVSEQEIRKAYKVETQEAKISYLLIPYESAAIDENIPLAALEDFYKENKDLFRQKPKVKARYISLEPDTKKSEDIIAKLEKNDSFEKLEEVTIEETDFFEKNEPIKNLGFMPQVNQLLFSLENNQLSNPVSVKDRILVFQKIDEKDEFTPPFSEIQEEVKKAYIKNQAENQTKKLAESIIEEIKATNNKELKKYSEDKNIKFKQTDFFKYSDYIEGVGLSRNLSQLVFFELKEGQIYPNPIVRKNGVYIVKLDKKTDLDQEDFEKKKEEYRQSIRERKELREKIIYLSKLRQELSFNLNLPR
jgi:hypothetical protein